MFKKKLYTILDDLNKMVSKDNAIERCVNSKLDSSLDTYVENVDRTCSYLLTRSIHKVVRNIAKQKD